jgi:hypothetical protein
MSVQRRHRSIALVLSFSIMNCALASHAQDWKGTIQKEDGVVAVRNTKRPMFGDGALTLTEELSIGRAEGQGADAFFRPWYLAVDDEENIYVMDQGDCQVKVFNKNGEFLRAIGRRGEGPGELQHPDNIFLTADRRLVIEDFIRNLTHYSLDGHFVKMQSTARIFPIDVLVDSSGRVFALQNVREPEISGKEIVLYDENLKLLQTVISFPRPKPDPQVLEPFQPEIYWALLKGNGLAVSGQAEYVVDIFGPQGNLVKKITRDYDPVKITEEDVKQRVRKIPEGRTLAVPKYFPAISSLTADDEGRLYVRTNEKGPGSTCFHDVFDPDGKYLAKIALKNGAQVWKNSRLYSIEEDEAGFQVVKRYRVNWNLR